MTMGEATQSLMAYGGMEFNEAGEIHLALPIMPIGQQRLAPFLLKTQKSGKAGTAREQKCGITPAPSKSPKEKPSGAFCCLLGFSNKPAMVVARSLSGCG